MTVTALEGLRETGPTTREAVQEELDEMFRLHDEDAGEALLIRHAEQSRGEAGSADPLLTCTGLEQAELLAQRLRSVWIEAFYSAPERRARQTAQVLASVTGRPLHVEDGLADIDFDAGRSAGISAGSYARRFEVDPRWDSLPGFASGKPFRKRVLQAVEGILAQNPARRIAVVTHSSVINAYLSILLCIPRDQFFAAEHTSVSIVRWQEERYVLRILNDASHLGPNGAGLESISKLLPAVHSR